MESYFLVYPRQFLADCNQVLWENIAYLSFKGRLRALFGNLSVVTITVSLRNSNEVTRNECTYSCSKLSPIYVHTYDAFSRFVTMFIGSCVNR